MILDTKKTSTVTNILNELCFQKERLEYFSCGHVIPKDNIICLGLATGPTGVKFDFSYNSRDSTQVVIYPEVSKVV